MRPGLPIDPRDSGDPSLEDHLGAALRDDDDELGTTRDEPPPRARSSTHSEPTRDELGTTRDEPVPDMVIPRQLTRPSSANAAAAPRREPPNLGPATSMTRLEPPKLGPSSAPVTRPATLPPGIRLEPPNLPPPSGISHRDPGRDPDPVSADLTLRDPPNLPPTSGITRRDVGRDPPPSGITRRDPPPARLAVSGEIADEIASTHADALGLTRDSSQRLRPLLAATATPSNRDIDTTAADRSSNLGATLAAPPSKDAPIPRQIGRYAVLRRLGRGGMGTVYAAYDEQLTRRVAIKILHAGIETGDRAPLVAEARAMAQLSHPNVVQVYELGEHDHHDFLAMEYVEGRTLGDWLTADRPPWQLVLRRFIAAGEGLAAAHRAGLVHRDFKPKPSRLPPKAPLPRNAVDLQQSGLLRGRRSGQGWSGVVRMAQTWPKSWARSRPSTVPPGVVVRDDARPSLEPLAVEPAHDLSSPIAGIWRAAGSRSPAPRAAPATPAQRRRRRPASSGWRTSSPRRRTCPSNPAGTRGSLGRHGFSCS